MVRLSGLSVSQVARRYDVNANLVFTWLRDARFTPEEVEPPIEALVSEATSGPSNAAATFLPVELIEEDEAAPARATQAASPATGTMEIVLAGGHRLRVEGAYDPHALARRLPGLTGSAS